MTLEELYNQINGNYKQAMAVLRVEKLVDKHIRKYADNGVIVKLLETRERMDPAELFDAAHAAKGVCANLGLVELSELSSQIAEEFRPGNERKLSDEEVAEIFDKITALHKITLEGIQEYQSQNG